MMKIEEFKKLPLMGIVRGIDIKDIEPLVKCVIKAGLKTIEITMNTFGAEEIIKKAISVSAGRITVGAGTVLTSADLERATVSGAEFIVSPILNKDVIDICIDNNIPVFPGAFSPQEVCNAWELGATMVKVFPSSVFGHSYIKELKGPFNDIKIIAVGGVRPGNIKDFFTSGADAVAFGGSVFREELIMKKDFDSISDTVSKYVSEVDSLT